MSIFIGKSSSGTNVVHITKGVTTENLMKTDNILPNTVFSTTQALASYRLIPLTYQLYRSYNQINGWDSGFLYTMVNTWFSGGYDADYNRYSFVPVTGIRKYSMPASDYSYLISSMSTRPNRYLFLGNDYSVLGNVGLANMISLTEYTSTYGQRFSCVPSTSYGFGIVNFQFNPSPQVYYILIIEDDFYPSLNGQITINNTGLYIGSTNIFEGRKLVSSVYNPSSIKVTDELCLVDIPLTGAGFELVTDSNISIKVGGIELFNSGVNSFLPFKPNTTRSITLSVPYSISTVDTLLYTMSDNESFCIVGMTIDYFYRTTTAYAFATRGNSNVITLGIRPYEMSGGYLRMDFTYVYTNNGNVYIRTDRAGGGAPTSYYSYTFSVEAF